MSIKRITIKWTEIYILQFSDVLTLLLTTMELSSFSKEMLGLISIEGIKLTNYCLLMELSGLSWNLSSDTAESSAMWNWRESTSKFTRFVNFALGMLISTKGKLMRLSLFAKVNYFRIGHFSFRSESAACLPTLLENFWTSSSQRQSGLESKNLWDSQSTEEESNSQLSAESSSRSFTWITSGMQRFYPQILLWICHFS